MNKRIMTAIILGAMLAAMGGAEFYAAEADTAEEYTAYVSASEAEGSAGLTFGNKVGTPFTMYRSNKDDYENASYAKWINAAKKAIEKNKNYKKVKEYIEGAFVSDEEGIYYELPGKYKGYYDENYKFVPKITGAVKGDFDGDSKVEAYVTLDISDYVTKKSFLVYVEHDGKGRIVVNNSDAVINSVIDYGSFSHIVVETDKKLKICTNKAKVLYTVNSTWLQHDDNSNFLVASDSGNDVAVFWDKSKKRYIDNDDFPGYCGDPKSYFTLRREFEAICENYSMLISAGKWGLDPYMYGNIQYDMIEETDEMRQKGYYYVPINPKYASTKEELYNRIRSSLSVNFISDAALKKYMFEPAKMSVWNDDTGYYSISVPRFREGKNGLEVFYECGPGGGYSFDYDTFFVVNNTGKTANVIVMLRNSNGECVFRQVRMKKSSKYGWQLDAWEDTDGKYIPMHNELEDVLN